jgi:hypothetical protein
MQVNHIAWTATLADDLNRVRVVLNDGDMDAVAVDAERALNEYGFALVSGLGIEDPERIADRLLALGSRLGKVTAQSPRGELVEDVRDFSDIDERDDRGYRSRGELSPHSDPTTLIALHCLAAAKSGGESYLVNVRSIHDAIEAADPELLQELYKPMPHWQIAGSRGVSVSGPSPNRRAVFAKGPNGVSAMIYRPFIDIAADALGEPLSPKQTAALDLFEKTANSDVLALRFHLQPGQTMILRNRTVLHARTDYEDWPDHDRRRHLLRIWVDSPTRFASPDEHAIGELFDAV